MTAKLTNIKTATSLMALGALLTGIGILLSLILSRNDRQAIEIISNSQNPAGSSDPLSAIQVDVSGAVEHPGVYSLPHDSRIVDALAQAGGLSAAADREYISRSINLAQRIVDGAKIYIPSASGNHPNASNNSENAPSSPLQISINTATLTQLDSLWGVGESRAQAIIAGRPYNRLEELTERKILPQNVFDKNKEKLTL